MRIVLSIVLLVHLSSCATWGSLTYYSDSVGQPVVGKDFRLDVGYNFLKEIEGTSGRHQKLREMLAEQVKAHQDCEASLVDFEYGCLEGCGIYYVTASCDDGLDH